MKLNLEKKIRDIISSKLFGNVMVEIEKNENIKQYNTRIKVLQNIFGNAMTYILYINENAEINEIENMIIKQLENGLKNYYFKK